MTPLVPGTMMVIVGIAVATLFIYLATVALLLNRAFGAQVRNTAARELLATRIRPTVALYGVHLLLYVGLGYLILLLTVLIAIEVFPATIWLLATLATVPLATVLLPTAALVAALLSVWAVLHGLLARKQQADDFELLVDMYRQGPLFAICADVAAAVGTPMVNQIALSGRPGISVREEGSLLTALIGRPERTLVVGAPSIIHLTVGQFRAMLAHELGHISNRDTAWTALTFRAASAVACARRTTALTHRLGAWWPLLTLLNPAYLLTVAFGYLHLHLTIGFARIREILADEAARGLYGSKAFDDGLRRMVLNDALFNLMFSLRLRHYAAETPDVPARAFVALDREFRTISTHQLLVLWNETISQRPSFFDPHPPVQDRLRRVAADPIPGELTMASSENDDLRIADLIGWTAVLQEPAALTAALQQIEASSDPPHRNNARSLA
jgi:Zn-dependent protease with chaperone function